MCILITEVNTHDHKDLVLISIVVYIVYKCSCVPFVCMHLSFTLLKPVFGIRWKFKGNFNNHCHCSPPILVFDLRDLWVVPYQTIVLANLVIRESRRILRMMVGKHFSIKRWHTSIKCKTNDWCTFLECRRSWVLSLLGV